MTFPLHQQVHGYAHIIFNFLVPVPVLHITTNHDTDNLEAGSSLTLMCNSDMDSSVDSPIEKQVIWIVNDTVIDLESSRISTLSDGHILIYTSLATSDTGRYFCRLTLTVQETNMFIRVQESPVLSSRKDITVQSNDNLLLYSDCACIIV